MRELSTQCITRLRPYFQAHTIYVLTNHPLRQVLQKPETSGRLVKWAIELGEFDIHYKPRPATKGQAVADFISEFTERSTMANGSSNAQGCGAGLVLISPDKVVLEYALRFKFHASNNEAEYEALLAGLRFGHRAGHRPEYPHGNLGSAQSTRAPLIRAIDHSPTWMDPILRFLRNRTLPADPAEARRVRYRSPDT
ncbi:unnamed protein product [Prunus brigantina]